MSHKWRRRSYQTFALLIGLLFGLWRPQATQAVLPIIGIIVGIGYFILSRQEKELEEISWFLLIQMLMYFLIGSALSSTILISFEVLG
jgi:hypothetical protein